MKIKIGEIYKNEDNKIRRVIGGDELEVFYEAYWSHDNSWGTSSNLSRKAFFYRMKKNAFLKSSERIDFKEFSDLEFDVIRPDLPIRIGRVKDVSWGADIFSSEKKLNEFLIENTETDPKETIDASMIYLYPFGPKGGLKKAELIKAKKEKLTILEILINASKVNNNVNQNKSDGVGIYRLGIHKKKPSYYIGGYKDLAGIL